MIEARQNQSSHHRSRMLKGRAGRAAGGKARSAGRRVGCRGRRLQAGRGTP